MYSLEAGHRDQGLSMPGESQESTDLSDNEMDINVLAVLSAI
jgi:hypothetical protein